MTINTVVQRRPGVRAALMHAQATQPATIPACMQESFSLDAATLAKVCDSNTIARMFGLPAKTHALEVTSC